MEINILDLTKSKLEEHQDLIAKCNSIIKENLQSSGGPLKKADIFSQSFDWAYLITASINNEIVGFALTRMSENMHELKGSDSYYYISDIAVRKKYARKGIGTALLATAIKNRGDLPIVASALKTNRSSIRLLSKFMSCYGISKKLKYLRFVDNASYNKLYEGINPEEQNILNL